MILFLWLNNWCWCSNCWCNPSFWWSLRKCSWSWGNNWSWSGCRCSFWWSRSWSWSLSYWSWRLSCFWWNWPWCWGNSLRCFFIPFLLIILDLRWTLNSRCGPLLRSWTLDCWTSCLLRSRFRTSFSYWN